MDTLESGSPLGWVVKNVDWSHWVAYNAKKKKKTPEGITLVAILVQNDLSEYYHSSDINLYKGFVLCLNFVGKYWKYMYILGMVFRNTKPLLQVIILCSTYIL